MLSEERSYRRIIEALNRGDVLGYREIKSGFSLGRRQAKRVIDTAIANGVPIRRKFNERRVIYFIEGADRVTGVQVALTEDEMFALMVGAEAVQSSLGGTTLGEALQEGIRKLTECVRSGRTGGWWCWWMDCR